MLMKTKFFIFSILIFLILPTMAQKNKTVPNWVSYDKRDLYYPSDEYIKGFSSENLQSVAELNEAQARLASSARTILNESVLTEIKSMTTSSLVSKTSNKSAVTQEEFNQVSVSVSKLKLTDLASDFYFDEKTKNAYAFAYAPRAKVVESYVAVMEENIMLLKNLEAYAKDSTVQNKINLLNKLTVGGVYLQELSNAYGVLIALDGANKSDYQTILLEAMEIQKILEHCIERIQNSKELNAEEAQEFIAQNLAFQLDSNATPLWVANFTFENSGMISPYSDKFAMGLSQKMINSKLPITKNAKLSNKYLLQGFFWKESEYIRVNINVIDQQSGDVVAAVETGISKDFIENNSISIEPENYHQAIQNLALFNENLVTSNGGLSIDITTNKGSENLLFQENDTLKIYIRANKACYVRFIYHLADGSKVLLYDNYNITPSFTNKVIELPQYFVCTEPYGVETLQLVAQTGEFAPLEIVSQYGYDFIEGDLAKILKKTRGFKPAKEEDANAEKFLLITTMPKTW